MADITSALFLSLPDHGQAINETNLYGGGSHAYIRCLNVTGRWAARGSSHAPLLMWSPDKRDAAEAAAATASEARSRTVLVYSVTTSGSNGLGVVEAYSPLRSSALLGATPFTEAKILKTAATLEKLVAYTSAICRVYGDLKRPEAEIMKAKITVNRELHQQFGGGSITAAVAWLTGKKGLAAYDLMLTGDFNLDDAKTFSNAVAGMYLAQQLEHGQISEGLRLG